MVGILNFVNATGEYIISDVQTRASLQAVQTVGADMQKSIHSAFMDYQFLTNIIALIIQLIFVSRIFRWVGVRGALLFLPLIALGGYTLISFGAVLVLVRWVKALENGTDYSLQSTTKAALFLITPREEKYKAKVAIDTFFVRGGDTLSALTVLIGTQLLSVAIEKYAIINVVGVGIWIAICFLIMKEYRKSKAKLEEPQASL
jgi:AAA family ATP:ADP antiporter